MAIKRKKTGPARKKARKGKTGKKGLFMVLRQWSLPLFLLILIGFSLAATFYIIFLHTPTKPIF